MSWERALLDLFDDLETRAEGVAQELREEEVADLTRAEYAEVTLAQRLHGAVGDMVTVEGAGEVRLRGRLERVGRGCVAITPETAPRALHLVNLEHVDVVATASRQAAAEPMLGVGSRLGLASAVRHLAEEVDAVTLALSDGRRLAGQLGRVGADFLEVVTSAEDTATTLVPLRAVVLVVAD